MNDLIAETARGAIDLLRTKGWCRRTAINDSGQVCLARAVYESAGAVWDLATQQERDQVRATTPLTYHSDDEYNLYLIVVERVHDVLGLRDTLSGNFGTRSALGYTVITWNDYVALDREQVIAVLEKLAEQP